MSHPCVLLGKYPVYNFRKVSEFTGLHISHVAELSAQCSGFYIGDPTPYCLVPLWAAAVDLGCDLGGSRVCPPSGPC